MFIGRKDELKKLKELYDSDTFETAVLYGRRRIGKSQIIKESFNKTKDIPTIYFESIEAGESTIINFLITEINKKVDIKFNGVKTFDELMDKLFSYCLKHKLILAIDEYPRLIKVIKSANSTISNLIDRYDGKPKLKLILCGSEIDIMKSLFTSDNSLYGRIGTKLPIRQQDYYESSLFYPNYSNKEKLEIYTVFGGVPYYNQYINDQISVKDNIINLISSLDAKLLPEIESRLKIELSKMENCNEVLMALAKGKHKFSDILNESHVSSSPALADALDKLKKLEIISIINPINESILSKKTNYYIGDPLCKFYYKYIYWNYSSFQIMSSDDFYETFINSEFLNHDVPFCLENITKQYLVKNNRKGLYKPVLTKIGTYFYNSKENKNGEIDVVTESSLGYTIYEVKCTNKKVDMSILKDTIKKIDNLPIKYIKLGFVSASGYKDISNDDYILLTLEDLYK